MNKTGKNKSRLYEAFRTMLRIIGMVGLSFVCFFFFFLLTARFTSQEEEGPAISFESPNLNSEPSEEGTIQPHANVLRHQETVRETTVARNVPNGQPKWRRQMNTAFESIAPIVVGMLLMAGASYVKAKIGRLQHYRTVTRFRRGKLVT